MHHSNSNDEAGARELIALPDALRELPQLAPPAGVWTELSASLAKGQRESATHRAAGSVRAQPRRAWRQHLPVSLAAALALALPVVSILYTKIQHDRQTHARETLVVSTATKSGPSASLTGSAAKGTSTQMESNTDPLATLQTRSRALEGWLHDTSKASAPQSAQDLAASAEIQDMIGLIDVQLEGSDGANAVNLWQRRITLLEDLSTLRYASNVTRYETGIAQLDPAVTGTGALDTSWKN
jgi:hypothetical protein